MYLVEKAFIDKESKRLYEKGAVYKTDNQERAEKLRNMGFLGVELVVKEELPKKEQVSEEQHPKNNTAKKPKKKEGSQ